MSLIPPKTRAPSLKSGDEVVTVAASSAINNELLIQEGIKILKGWGLNCRQTNCSNRRWGYLAGNDACRHKNLYPQDPAPLLAFARGGWGAARLLELPQYWEQGWLVGFSDVTAILLARLAAGFDGGVHGPLITTLPKEPLWSQTRLRALLFGEQVPDLFGESWKGGICTGPLIVANLTVASHLLGSPYIPNLRGAILVLEDIGEAPYRIDRMLTHWRLTGAMKQIAGLGFGSFKNCLDPDDLPAEQSFQLDEVLKERSCDLGIPVVANLPIGHCEGNAALPLGRTAQLDGNKGILRLLP